MVCLYVRPTVIRFVLFQVQKIPKKIIMGRKPVTNPAVQLSVSLPRDLVERIDRIPGSRSQVIQKSLKETPTPSADRLPT